MIGKVLRGTNARRLLYYLYGPGQANEHADPHLVAGFGDPAELEPERRLDGSRDFRRLAGLLAQPLALLTGPGYDKPVWHCSVRAAPEDRMLSDAEWARVAAGIMSRTGFAPGRRVWGSVGGGPARHGSHPRRGDARPPGRHPAAHLERLLPGPGRLPGGGAVVRAADYRSGGSHRRPPGHPRRDGTGGPPRMGRHAPYCAAPGVCAAAGGAGTERKFFARLGQAGVLVRKRHSTASPGEVTGYAVGLPHHTGKDGGVIWYGGGKLAADLTLPKLRARWVPSAEEYLGPGLPPQMARAVPRARIVDTAEQAGDEVARLQLSGLRIL